MDHAKVAALLAPGSSWCLDTSRRDPFDNDFSDLPERSVVRIVRFSGLGDLETLRLDAYGAKDGNNGNCFEENRDAEESRSSWFVLRPTTARSDEFLEDNIGLGGSGGRESSVYVMAGMVPSPIQPLSGSAGEELLASPEDEFRSVGSSSRDILRASSRSILSLH